jgi:hypothetical protein
MFGFLQHLAVKLSKHGVASLILDHMLKSCWSIKIVSAISQFRKASKDARFDVVRFDGNLRKQALQKEALEPPSKFPLDWELPCTHARALEHNVSFQGLQ